MSASATKFCCCSIKLRREEGLTYLFVSHDMGAVAQIADEIAVLYLGRIVEHGEAARVISQPAHPYTKALIAAVPSLGPKRADTHAARRDRRSGKSAARLPISSALSHCRGGVSNDRAGTEDVRWTVGGLS